MYRTPVLQTETITYLLIFVGLIIFVWFSSQFIFVIDPLLGFVKSVLKFWSIFFGNFNSIVSFSSMFIQLLHLIVQSLDNWLYLYSNTNCPVINDSPWVAMIQWYLRDIQAFLLHLDFPLLASFAKFVQLRLAESKICCDQDRFLLFEEIFPLPNIYFITYNGSILYLQIVFFPVDCIVWAVISECSSGNNKSRIGQNFEIVSIIDYIWKQSSHDQISRHVIYNLWSWRSELRPWPSSNLEIFRNCESVRILFYFEFYLLDIQIQTTLNRLHLIYRNHLVQ